MNTELLHKSMSHPESIAQPEVEALQQIVREFPYFGAAQTLLSRAYLNAQDHRLTDQVSHAAFYTGNRMGLYQLLHPRSIESAPGMDERTSIPETPPKALEVEPHTDGQQSEFSELASRVLEDEHTSAVTKPLEATDEEPIAVPVSQEATSEVSVEVAQQSDSIQDVQEHPSSLLQEQILIGAIADSIALEVIPERNDDHPQEQAKPTTDFGAWLKQRSRATGFTTNEKQVGSPDDPDEEPQSFYQSASVRGQHRMLQAESGEDKQRKIIDRFIQYEPKIERGRSPEYPQANMAKESLEEDPELVTETMAQLFARQGKFDKARKAYRKLMEQFPEKSVYFAAQLKSIEKFKK